MEYDPWGMGLVSDFLLWLSWPHISFYLWVSDIPLVDTTYRMQKLSQIEMYWIFKRNTMIPIGLNESLKNVFWCNYWFYSVFYSEFYSVFYVIRCGFYVLLCIFCMLPINASLWSWTYNHTSRFSPLVTYTFILHSFNLFIS